MTERLKKNRSRNKRRRVAIADQERSRPNEDRNSHVNAQFVKDENQVEMSVTVAADERNEFPHEEGFMSEDSDRNDMSFRREQDHEFENEQPEFLGARETENMRDRSRSRSQSQEVRDERQQIREIDAEMAMKFNELHQIMVKEGMTESLAMLECCTSAMGKKLSINANSNANTKQNKLNRINRRECDEKSEETIYGKRSPTTNKFVIRGRFFEH